jgi:hypothetical protein
LANEYITRRKEEGKSITIIFLVTLLYQWALHKPRRLVEWSPSHEDDNQAENDQPEAGSAVCLAKSQIAYILDIKPNTVDWCVKALKQRKMGWYIKRPYGLDKNGNRTVHHIKTMQWAFNWVAEVVEKLAKQFQTALFQIYHFRSIHSFGLWKTNLNLHKRE